MAHEPSVNHSNEIQNMPEDIGYVLGGSLIYRGGDQSFIFILDLGVNVLYLFCFGKIN